MAREGIVTLNRAMDLPGVPNSGALLETSTFPTSPPLPSSPPSRSVAPVPLTRYCAHVTKEACRAARGTPVCGDVHFRKIHHPWTSHQAGDCHFLQLCRFSNSTCRYQHWELDDTLAEQGKRPTAPPLRFCAEAAHKVPERLRAIPEPQWICCDLRPKTFESPFAFADQHPQTSTGFDLSTLGQFGVICMDPPWAIGIDVPYDTLTDHDLRELAIQALQDDGYLLLWVTGRAMESGRRLMTHWGYKRCSEIVWVKVNMMQNVIRTGRTGHFLNHTKEHCLVGVKGKPPRGVTGKPPDCDVIVSELRESSRKPDEIYGIANRLWPGARCLELFARQHNVGKPGWVALGNQLEGSEIKDPRLLERVRERYPHAGF